MNIFMRYPQGKVKALTLSYDDGVFQDIRLMKILDKHGIKCTFNVNSDQFAADDVTGSGRISVKQAKELYTNSGHEVAVHGATHPFLEQLPIHLAMDDILRDRKQLEEMFGTIIRGMAYPYGTYNDDVVSCMRCAGIVYSRTVRSTGSFYLPSDWMRLPATCHHNDSRLEQLCDEFLSAEYKRDPKLFYLWGHSYEFDNNDNWNVIEKFSKKMGGKDDIWYATNIEIYDYIDAYKRLIFSADGHTVYNPNAVPVWFATGGLQSPQAIKIEAGQTLSF